MGDRGRLVVPAEVGDRAGLAEGTTLVLLESAGGLVLLTRRQLRDRVSEELADTDLVSQLLTERRAAAAVEDAAWAAARWRPGEGLSLAARLCLALSARLGDRAVTADTAWGTGEGVEQLR